jgi:prophage DNA circulation protein
MSNILADASSFSNPYGAQAKGEWNLSKGVFTTKDGSTVFYYIKDPAPTQRTAIEQITDSGGRRLAIYEYPYRDGQRVADLGRKGETYTFSIKFFGLNYVSLFNAFLAQVVNSNLQGTLTHPVRGAVSARFRDYEFQHVYNEWNAITIKATFIEDNTEELQAISVPASSPDSVLRNALQFVTDAQSAISTALTEAAGLIALPGAILTSLEQRLSSITGQASRLLGQLVATFSTNAQLQSLATKASNVTGGVPQLYTGTATTQNGGSGTTSQLPPTLQVGFSPTTQTAVVAQIANFVNANQITTSQAVFAANQLRALISAAIADINTYLGNNGYDSMVQYRSLANSMQEAVESAISTAQNQIILYVVPEDMSLRMIAKNNGLDPDRQNDIEALNPYLQSVNLVSEGTQILVPSA